MKKRKKSTTKSKARKPAKRRAAASGAKRRARKAAAKRRAPKTRSRKPAARKRAPSVRRKKTAPRTAAAGASVERPRARLVRGWRRGLGAEAGGQSGDLEAIPRVEDVDSESVEELLEEGQSWEAGIVSGVEEADDEEGEVHTHEVPEDDVPDEYRDKD